MSEQELRDYIVNNTDESYFIKAGAGAGKTYIIVKRIINQLASGFLPSEIVVITFTEKASQELLSRIVFEVNEASVNEKDEKRKNNLLNALKNIDSMQISTIHSFCNKLIAERIFNAHLPVGVKLLMDEELEIKLREFFDAHYLEYREKIEKAEDIWNGNVTEKVFKLFQAILYLSDDTLICYDKKLLESDFDSAIEKAFNDFYDGLIKIASRYSGQEFKCLKDANKAFLSSIVKAYESNSYDDLYSITKKDEKSIIAKRGTPILKEYLEDAKQDVDELAEEYNKVAVNINALKVAAIADIAVCLRNDFKNQNKNFITNDDLLNIACKLVFEKEAYDFYHKKYKCFYVDEFQDTDHVQASMILKLCSKSFDDDDLCPGKLVVVGDYKQSIYRFRGADIAEYTRVENIFRKQEDAKIKIIDLSFNFRSSQHVIDYVNDNFKNKIDNYVPMIYSLKEKRDYALSLKNYDENKIIEGIYFSNTIITNKDVFESDITNIERCIKGLVNNYYVFDKKKNYRKIKYSDFLILTKNTTHMTKYVNELIKRGIPISLAGKIDVEDNIETNKFVRLYEYLSLNSPDQISKESILQQIYDDLTYKYKFDKNILDDLRNETKGYDGYSLALYMLNHLELILSAGLYSKEKMGSIESTLIQMVENVISNNENNYLLLIKAFYDYLKLDIKKQLSLSDDNNAVRFMNVHQSKGLEGKIVIIADRVKLKKDKLSSYRENKDGDYCFYPSVENGLNSGLVSYQNNDEIVQKSLREEKDELIRLEYTALTRAEEALIVLPGCEDGFVASYNVLRKNNHLNSIPFLEEDDKEKEYVDYQKKEDGIIDDCQKKALYKDVSPSKEEIHEDARPFKDARPKGMLFGTIMHRCFELCILNNELNDEYIIDKAILESNEEEAREYKDFLLKLLANFRDSEVMKLVKSSDKIECELPFYYFKDNQYIHGFLDLVVYNKDSITIVDYKSDAMYKDESGEEFLERLNKQYSPQLSLYKKAISNFYKISEDKIDTIIYNIEGV